jgi:hypothetical protein
MAVRSAGGERAGELVGARDGVISRQAAHTAVLAERERGYRPGEVVVREVSTHRIKQKGGEERRRGKGGARVCGGWVGRGTAGQREGRGGGVSLYQGWCSMAHIYRTIYRTTYIIHTYMHARGIVWMHIYI